MAGKHRKNSRTVARVAGIAASSLVAATLGISVEVQAAPVPGAVGAVPPRTSVSFNHSFSGAHVGTANEHESRPGLSIVKLYIADYVYDHGSDADRALAYRMLQTSDDGIASQLYSRYPQSIAETSRKYGLADTRPAPHWGNSTTSTFDSAKYLETRKRERGLGDPMLRALATASPVAADGYRQDFGTARLPGVIGTKWGWSDDRRSVHASASFGADFTVSAHTYGPSAQLTADVLGAFTGPAGASDVPRSPAHQAIDNATASAHGAAESVRAGLSSGAESLSAVPGSAGTAQHAHAAVAGAAAQWHRDIEGLSAQAKRVIR